MTSFMEGRRLKVTLVSAKNLPNIRSVGSMKVYAEVSLNGEPATARKSGSAVDKDGNTDPTWNFVVGYTVSEVVVQLPGVNLVVKLWCKRSLGDKLIGEVKIPIKNLFDESDDGKILSYDVGGTDNGVLNISCSFGQKMAVPTPAPPRQPTSSGNKIVAGIGLGLAVLGIGIDLQGDFFGGADDNKEDGGMDDAEAEADAGAEAEVEVGAKAKVEAEVGVEAKVEAGAEGEAEVGVEVRAEAKVEAGAEVDAEAEEIPAASEL